MAPGRHIVKKENHPRTTSYQAVRSSDTTLSRLKTLVA